MLLSKPAAAGDVYLDGMWIRVTVLVLLALAAVGSAAARTVEGTERSDVLVGTGRADAIFGRGGNDRIDGAGGTDFLSGGTGRDAIAGGPGNDRIVAQYDGGRDRVLCGRGLDVVNADLLDVVSPDCEVVSRRLSRDPYTDADSQHETQVEPDSLTVGRTTVAAFQVGRRFDGAATNVGYAVSTDDGRSWRSGLLPGLTRASRPAGTNVRATDPVVAYHSASRTWLIGTLALEGPVTRLTVSRSADGVTWSTPVIALEDSSTSGVAFDKNWLACDNGASSPFRGRCYLVYTDALRSDRIASIASTDGGVTWSAPVGIPVTDAVGAFPVVRPDGDLVVAFLWSGRRIGSSVSDDGAASFSAPAVVADLEVRTIRALRFFPLPSADVDPSGRVWVTWHDCRFSVGCEENSVVVSTSVDGRVWSAPSAITSGRNAMLPAVGIHPTFGRAAFVYHVVRPGGVDVELVEVGPDRRRLGPPRRLSAQTMRLAWMPNTVSGRMLADYLSVHYAGTRPLAVWILASEPVGTSLRQAVYATRG
jgi:Ca2+-binding RTX toxin-like protein